MQDHIIFLFATSGGKMTEEGDEDASVFTDAEVYEERLKRCRNCENSRTQLAVTLCMLCGCVMRLKAKLSGARCAMARKTGVDGWADI